MDAHSSWWVSETLAADCEKAWPRIGWGDIMQKWYECLCDVKEKDEAKKMDEEHQEKISQMIKSTHGSAALLHKITKPTAWRGGVQILMKEEEDAKPMDAKRREKSGQSIGGVMCKRKRISFGKMRS